MCLVEDTRVSSALLARAPRPSRPLLPSITASPRSDRPSRAYVRARVCTLLHQHLRPSRPSLEGNSIGNDGAAALAAVLPQCASLQALSYVFATPYQMHCAHGQRTGPRFRPSCALDGVSAAMPDIWRPYRTHISLAGNSITDDGAKTLARTLPNCTSLQQLTYVQLLFRAQRLPPCMHDTAPL